MFCNLLKEKIIIDPSFVSINMWIFERHLIEHILHSFKKQKIFYFCLALAPALAVSDFAEAEPLSDWKN